MPDIAFGVDRLALEVGRIDLVVINQRQLPDPRRGEILQRRRSDPAQPDQHHMRLGQRELPGAADLGQHDMARETVEAVGL